MTIIDSFEAIAKAADEMQRIRDMPPSKDIFTIARERREAEAKERQARIEATHALGQKWECKRINRENRSI